MRPIPVVDDVYALRSHQRERPKDGCPHRVHRACVHLALRGLLRDDIVGVVMVGFGAGAGWLRNIYDREIGKRGAMARINYAGGWNFYHKNKCSASYYCISQTTPLFLSLFRHFFSSIYLKQQIFKLAHPPWSWSRGGRANGDTQTL